MAPRALIAGIAGQDGTYLTELLAGKGYEVVGLLGPHPGDFSVWAARYGDQVRGAQGDLSDPESLTRALRLAKPDEVYNLAGFSSVGASWQQPVLSAEVNAVGALRLLEAVREAAPEARFVQASSADIFGQAEDVPQNEETPIRPRSPYAVAKAFAHFTAQSFREGYGMHASNAILYSHESPRRAPGFVTRKIAEGAARAKLGRIDELRLGNLDAARDWGFAGDYVEALWRMTRVDQSGDYVIATGVRHTVRDFCAAAFGHVGLDWQDYVVVDTEFLRPADPAVLVGDASKARRVLGWEPSVDFAQIVAMMVEAHLERLSR